MVPVDPTPTEHPPDPLDQVQHDLKTPLTAIHGRAHLLARAIRRSPSLADEERAKMLEGMATIETAVHAMVTLIDGMGSTQSDGPTDSPSTGNPDEEDRGSGGESSPR